MPRKRSYSHVSVDPAHRVLLDGRPVPTPNGAILVLPSDALAQAIAEEWRAQDEIIRAQTMVLTRLANTAIDRVAPDPSSARKHILAFANTDVVCYRADAPADLVGRQQLVWNPLLTWLNERFGASLRAADGVAFIEQDEAAIEALAAELERRDTFFLAALYAAAALSGSLVTALALAERKLTAEDAFAAANLDKIYQAERWGWDEAERAKSAAERAELEHISRFLDLLPR